MKASQFSSVWDAIEETPEAAAHMKLRSELMMALERHIKSMGWTQAEAAKHLKVTQPRISDLTRGKIELFAIDSLITMLAAAGLKVELQVSEAA
jgi:predicted XRE-type DNA-binding protein